MKAEPAYVAEMLEFAKTLRGRELKEVEKRIASESSDPWDYFMMFGIQPETQRYIDYTIKLLEKCEDLGQQCTCESRLDFSVEELGLEYPDGSMMKTYWEFYAKWKAEKDAAEGK
jgi:hypothetical protein